MKKRRFSVSDVSASEVATKAKPYVVVRGPHVVIERKSKGRDFLMVYRTQIGALRGRNRARGEIPEVRIITHGWREI